MNITICDLITQALEKQENSTSSNDIQQEHIDADVMQMKFLQSDEYRGIQIDRADEQIFKEVIIHLDFKGAPPTFEYLKDFINYFGKHYKGFVTGFLFEFEDTFPFEGVYKVARADNHYSTEQIKEIVELVKSLNLKIIPLVQTFGHLEYLLKY